MEKFYSTKRIYIVIDSRGRIIDSLEQPVRLAKDWRCYLQKELHGKACLPNKSKEEKAFLAKWQGKERYDIIVGIAGSLESLISSVPEIEKRQSFVNLSR